jgi:hypothetical protein
MQNANSLFRSLSHNPEDVQNGTIILSAISEENHNGDDQMGHTFPLYHRFSDRILLDVHTILPKKLKR